MFQKFDFLVNGRKGIENQIADHLPRLEDEVLLDLGYNGEINDMFTEEKVFATYHNLIPWFADIANYLANDLVHPDWLSHQRKKFMHYVKKVLLG